MSFRKIVCAATLACTFTAPSFAVDTISAITSSTDSFMGYMGVMTDISVTGSTTLPSTAFAFCIEGSKDWPGFDVKRQYELADGFGTFLEGSAPVDKATAMLHYMVDHYYHPLMQGVYGNESGYGFNEAVWQLTDFKGNRADLSVAADDDGDDRRGDYALYSTIMGDLYNNYDAILPSYRSSQYNIQFLKETNPELQSVAVLTPVPEPSAVFMMLAGGACIAGVVRRRRQSGR